ncbi:serine protease [Pelagicoccus sp. SDUM812005]|uniref:S1 family peptidase n=1 Tax=Pelagicoccus sp. SDUM812005 TaxID=3041257 RepID=UPI00280D4914|nr:serine protease [Pelagicoccus sp. SDUM812005]MDQ8181718.1 serine protease [Pelagicoccus sp. SDUM812005]
MRKASFLALVACISALHLDADDPIRPSIVGGQDASEGEFPWMAAFLRTESDDSAADRQFCGGALIAPNWIVTAAHCVDDESRQFEIMVGNTDLSEAYVPIKPVSIHLHPSFQSRRLSRGSDIALIQIDPPIENYPTLPLNRALSRIVPGRKVTALGWGLTDYQSNANTSTLKQVELTLREIDEYETNHPVYDYFLSTEIHQIDRGIHSGDSGGPLLLPNEDGEGWQLVGITSYSRRSIDFNQNAPFFASPTSVLDWIDRTLASSDTVPEAPPQHQRVKLFTDDEGNTHAGYKHWPFAGRRSEQLSVHWRYPFLHYYNEFPFIDIGNYYDETDGSFIIVDSDYRISPRDNITRASLATLTIEEKPTYKRPLFQLSPFERIFFKENAYGTGVLLQNLQADWSYSMSTHYSGDIMLQNRTSGKIEQRLRDTFTASPDYNYWFVDSIGRSNQYISLLPQPEPALTVGESHRFELTPYDTPYIRPQTYIKLLQLDSGYLSGEAKITVLPEFDAEIIVLEPQTGSTFAYGDHGAENEIDDLILDGSYLYGKTIGIYNFDKGVTGSFEIKVERHTSPPLAFDQEQIRGITSFDRHFTSRGNTLYYERLSITNDRNYRSLTFDIHGRYFRPGISIFDGEGETLEFLSDQQDYEVTVPVSRGETIIIDVINFEGTPTENYEILVTGSTSAP